jgi:hypothetical protein
MAQIDAHPGWSRSTAFRAGIISVAVALLTFTGCSRTSDNPAETSAGGGAKAAYDTQYTFGAGGNAASIKTSGWQKAEEQFTWTDGKQATLVIPITAVDTPVTLRMQAQGMIKEPEFPTTPVEVLANDRKIADWEVGNTAPFSAPIPPEITKAGGKLTLTFKIPKAASPKELGKGEDVRVLGMCVHNLELSTK